MGNNKPSLLSRLRHGRLPVVFSASALGIIFLTVWYCRDPDDHLPKVHTRRYELYEAQQQLQRELEAEQPRQQWQPPFSARRKYALIDTQSIVQNVSNAHIAFGVAKKHPRRLFTEDQAWEPRIDNGYPNVHYDPHLQPPFRLWYDCCIKTRLPDKCLARDKKALLYAESDDGFHWRKPPLGLVEFKGSKENNIIMQGTHGLGVFRDPQETDPQKIFKAVGEFEHPAEIIIHVHNKETLKKVEQDLYYSEYWDALTFQKPITVGKNFITENSFIRAYVPVVADKSKRTKMVVKSMSEFRALASSLPVELHIRRNSYGAVATSPDGLRWGSIRHLTLNNRWDTHSWMIFDSNRQEYVGFTRGNTHTADRKMNRTILRFSLSDWDAEPQNQEVVASGRSLSDQLYSMVVFQFYNIYLGLVNTYDNNIDRVAHQNHDDRVRCELMWSPDSIQWHRLSDEGRRTNKPELILQKPEDKYDAYDCFYSNPVVVGEEVYLFYMGGDGPHMSLRNTSFNLAKLRMDGFVGWSSSASVSDAPSTLFTKAMACYGSTIRVTADVQQGGSLRVALLLPTTFNEVSLRGLEDSIPLQKSATDHVMLWKRSTLIAGRLPTTCVVSIEFRLATVYTFGWAA